MSAPSSSLGPSDRLSPFSVDIKFPRSATEVLWRIASTLCLLLALAVTIAMIVVWATGALEEPLNGAIVLAIVDATMVGGMWTCWRNAGLLHRFAVDGMQGVFTIERRAPPLLIPRRQEFRVDDLEELTLRTERDFKEELRQVGLREERWLRFGFRDGRHVTAWLRGVGVGRSDVQELGAAIARPAGLSECEVLTEGPTKCEIRFYRAGAAPARSSPSQVDVLTASRPAWNFAAFLLCVYI